MFRKGLDRMRRILLGLLGVLSFGLVAGALFLGFYDFPAPSRMMEVVVPNERLIPQ